MIILIPQTLLLSVFGIALYFLWCAAAPSERWLRWIAAIGFVVRAIGAQALFWISWAHLPILRSLQTTDGYWIFARDSSFYFPQAVAAAEEGWRAIVYYDRGSAGSLAYVQLLASTIWLLGRPICVGILLNLFSYLGTIAVLVGWRREEPRTCTTAAVAIVAISVTPSLVLWSLQPLKDSLFQFLFVAFVGACATLQRVWLANGSWRKRAIVGALLGIILLVMTGIRWYVAAALVAATSIFLLIIAVREGQRKTLSLAAAAMLIVVLTLSVRPHMPRSLMPQRLLENLERVRIDFDSAAAGTTLRSGDAAEPRRLSADDERIVRAFLDDQVAAWNRSDFTGAMNGYWKSPQLESVEGTTTIRGWDQVGEVYRRRLGAVRDLRMSVMQVTGAEGTATVSGRWNVTTRAGQQTPQFTTTLRRFPNGEWKIVREVFPSWTQTTAPGRASLQPERLLIGVAAMVVPYTIARRLGLFRIDGGRGLLWFADIDTLIFDFALLLALRALFARGICAWRDPLTWLLVLTMLIVVPPLAYSISNFGTLFRLREVVYVGLLLMPIGVAAAQRQAWDRGT